MEERDYRFTEEKKERMKDILFGQKALPALPYEVERVSYLDGVKTYFKNGGWVIARFSGTEPLLRLFCEMPSRSEAIQVCGIYERFLAL